jgi:hypothetical protein
VLLSCLVETAELAIAEKHIWCRRLQGSVFD